MFWEKPTIKDSVRAKPPARSRPMRTTLLQKIVLGALIKTFLIAGIIALGRSPGLQVRTIEAVGAHALDPGAIESAAREAIAGHYVWLIPKSNIMLISKRTWERSIMERFPSIERATISFPEKQSARISVRERSPAHIWCSQQSGTRDCFFTDRTGIVFEPAPRFSPGVYLVFRGGPLAPQQSPLLKQFLPTDAFANLQSFVEQLSRIGIAVNEILLQSHNDVTFLFDTIGDVRVAPQSQLRTNSAMHPERTLTTLTLLLKDDEFQRMLAQNPTDLEYIDVRFPAKIIYKFKQQAAASSAE